MSCQTEPGAPFAASRLGSRGVRVLAAILALVGAGCIDGNGAAPYEGCPSPGIDDTPPVDSEVPAGSNYVAYPRFAGYPCIRSQSGCSWTIVPPWPLPVWTCVDGPPVQSTCAPRLELIAAPESTIVVDGSVHWNPLRADEGRTVQFEVETRYPAQCSQRRASWSVTVLPGPPAPVLRSVTLDRQDVRAGERVTVTADFEHGTGSWDFGPLESGVPATSEPLTTSRLLEVSVTGGIWETVSEKRLVSVWGQPAVTGLSASATTLGDPGLVELTWFEAGASSRRVSPAPEVLAPGRATVRVDATTTYTVVASNPLGDEASAQVTITVVPRAVVETFVASPPAVAVGEAPVLVAGFANGVGRLEAHRGMTAWSRLGWEALGPVEPGVPFPAPIQRGADWYRLVVTDPLGREVITDLTVPTAGPGSFSLLPAGAAGRTHGPQLVPLAGGRLMLAGGLSALVDQAARIQVLDVDTGLAAPVNAPPSIRVFEPLDDGRVVATEQPSWLPGGLGPFWSWIGPFAVVDPDGVRDTTWPVPADPVLLESLRLSAVVPLGGPRILALPFGAPGPILVDLDAGTFEPVARAVGVPDGLSPACRLADGRVLLAAGSAIYDPVLGSVMPHPGPPGSGTLSLRLRCLGDGSALSIDAFSSPDGVTRIHRYDPVALAWGPVAEGPPRIGAEVELPGGRILLLDATDGWELELLSGRLERKGRMALPRDESAWYQVALARLADGRVVAHGPGGDAPELYVP